MSEPTVEVASIIVRVGTSALTMKPAEAKALRDELLKLYPVEDALKESRQLEGVRKAPWDVTCPDCGAHGLTAMPPCSACKRRQSIEATPPCSFCEGHHPYATCTVNNHQQL